TIHFKPSITLPPLPHLSDLLQISVPSHSLRSSSSLHLCAPSATSGDYFFWYKQLPGQEPLFLLSHLGNGKPLKGKPGMSVSMASDRERVHLHMEDVALEHSAVYYCAVTHMPHSRYKNISSS
uniref:Immunoglobulin V-set domain-containing protein n=1 Tax=Hippocampus comes TaxID=109280 RepID=A0A3Q2Y0W2_HIPCM